VFGVVMTPVLEVGTLAQYATVSAAYGLARIPAGLSARDAGALGLAGTAALNSLDTAQVADGDTVLVSGATGGVGALAVQLAAARGATVIATARPGAEADFVTGLTAADVHVVDHTGDLGAQIRAIAPDGVDVVLHLAGDGVELAGLLGKGGRIASTRGLTPDAVEIQDVTVHPIMADPNNQTLTALAEQAAAGKLRVPVTATYPLEQAPQAFTAFSEGTLGKIAVTCS
jgi:NADPH:quinone reductase-like Zn-dependent oxidoreductase